MQALIVASEFPYPANHGGRIDMWNRILAFKNNKVSVFLLCWYNKANTPKQEDIDYVGTVVDRLVVLPYLPAFTRAIFMARYPSLAAARILPTSIFEDIINKAKKFNPNFVFIDNIHAGVTGLKIAETLKVPSSVRLHNIEHQYLLGQYKNAKSFYYRLQLLASILHIKKYEYSVIARANHFFDISLSDLEFWKSQGFSHGHWLPPFHHVPVDIGANSSATQVLYQVGFIGNLYTPNNVQGLLWFVNDVLPVIKKKAPQIKVVFIGSKPSEVITQLCLQNGIKLIANPPNIQSYLPRIEILINPVKFSSGVNIKAIDMLFSDNEVVSTTSGVKGLPSEIADVFFIADNPEEFANQILTLLAKKTSNTTSKRQLLRKLFDGSMLHSLLKVMASKT